MKHLNENMTVALLCELIGAQPNTVCLKNMDAIITGFEVDKMKPGCAFFTVVTENTNSYNFDHTLAGKAAVIVTDKDTENLPCAIVAAPKEALYSLAEQVRESYENLRTVAVTGSIGKTTSKDLIYSVLSQDGKCIKNEGSLNGAMNGALRMLRLNADCKYSLNEMGLRSPNQSFRPYSRVIHPDTCVFTNIGTPHIENFRNKTHILEEKLYCAEYMSKKDGLLILNADDETLMSYSYDFRVETYSVLDEKADYFAKDIVVGNDSVDFVYVGKNESYPVHLNVTGRQNVYGALMAIAVANRYGITHDKIVDGLATFRTGGIRQKVNYDIFRHNTTLTDCYGAAPESMISAFTMFSELKRTKESSRKIVVLGHMMRLGRFSEEFHREIGRAVVNYDFDLLVTYNAASVYYTEEAKKLGMDAVHFDDEADVIGFLKDCIRPYDMILFKGIYKFCNFEVMANRVLDEKYVPVAENNCGLLKDCTKMHTNARAACVMLSGDNRIVFGKNIRTRLNVSSLTMILSALTAIENADVDDIVTVDAKALSQRGVFRKMGLNAGDEYKLIDLLGAAMIYSAFDAMNAVAVYVGGSVENFVNMINRKAALIGAADTHFYDACGKSGKENYSTAEDMGLIVSEAMRNPIFAALVKKNKITATNRKNGESKEFVLQSKLVNYDENDELCLYTPGIVRVKNGRNNDSLSCIVCAMKYRDNYLTATVLGANDNDYNLESCLDVKRMLQTGAEKLNETDI